MDSDLKRLFKIHAEFCKVLANERRMAILFLLREGERSVGELAAELDVPVSNVSQHLRVMKEKGAVISRKEGQTVFYRVVNEKYVQGCQLIRQGLIEEHRLQSEVVRAAGAKLRVLTDDD